MEVHGLSGLRLKSRVEVDAVLKEFHQIEAGHELGTESSRVPSGATGEFVLLEQSDLGASSSGEVVEQAASGDAASDDHHFGF